MFYDQIQRLLLEDVSCCYLTLHHNLKTDLVQNLYQKTNSQKIINEIFVATCLIATGMKSIARFGLQINTNEGLNLLQTAINKNQEIILKANFKQIEQHKKQFDSLLNQNCYLMMSYQLENAQCYQSIVECSFDNIADCINSYFEQSEQASKKIYITTDLQSQITAGVLLHQLPLTTPKIKISDIYQKINNFTAKQITKENIEQIFNQFGKEISSFTPLAVQAHCDCSKERFASALKMLPKEDLNEIFQANKGNLEINCEQCGTKFNFNTEIFEKI